MRMESPSIQGAIETGNTMILAELRDIKNQLAARPPAAAPTLTVRDIA
jgi:hypothetical protein